MRSPRRLRLPVLLLLAAACLVLTFTARAQIGVSNLVDKSSSYDDRVTFYITNSPGFTYLALLNGQPVSIGSAVLVDKPDYYELAMWRTNTTTSAVATRREGVRFFDILRPGILWLRQAGREVPRQMCTAPAGPPP